MAAWERFESLRDWLRRARRSVVREADLDEEIGFHLAERAEALRRLGLTPAQAESQAAREFGDREAARAELAALDAGCAARHRRTAWLEEMHADARIALRVLRRRPAAATGVVVTLALGVGAAVAAATLVDAALLRPLPYRDVGRLVHLWERSTGSERQREASYPEFERWRAAPAAAAALEGLEGYTESNLTITTADGGLMVRGASVTAGFFDLLGVTPAQGRGFLAGEDAPGGAPVVVITDAFWRSRMGSRPDALGASVTVNGRSFLVVGILPASFHFAPVEDAALWFALEASAALRTREFNHWLRVVARMRPGATAGDAARALSAATAAGPPGEAWHAGARVVAVPLRDELTGPMRPLLLLLIGTAALVLAIAITNVAALQTARAAERHEEMALRAALGAGRGRLLRQVATEGLVLAALAGAGGLAVAAALRVLMLGMIPDDIRAGLPFLDAPVGDLRTLAEAGAVAAVAGILAAIVPAWQATRLAGRVGGPARGPRRRPGRDLLLGAQVGLATVLLIGAGLLGRSLAALARVDPGFRTTALVTARVSLTGDPWNEVEARQRFFADLLTAAGDLPGVERVGAVSRLPLGGGGTSTLQADGVPEPPGGPPVALVRTVAGDYFTTIGIPVRSGRTFDVRDDADAPPVIVVSEALARQLAPEGRVLGLRARFSPAPEVAWEIVGVVGDIRARALDEPPQPAVYLPLAQNDQNRFDLVVASRMPAAVIHTGVARWVRQVDPGIAVYAATTLERLVAESPAVFRRRLLAGVLGAFAVVGVVLAVAGVAAAVAEALAQRQRELAIRRALGATPAMLLWWLLRRQARLAACGIGAGVVVALVTAPLLGAMLYGTGARDPVVIGAGALGMLVTALLAGLAPARRAAQAPAAAALR